MSAEFCGDKDGNITMKIDDEDIDYPFAHLADLEKWGDKENDNVPAQGQPNGE